MEFPDQRYTRAFLNEPGYQAVAATRHAAACTKLIQVERYGGKGTNG